VSGPRETVEKETAGNRRLRRDGSPMYAHLLDLVATAFFLAFPIISPYGYEALYSYTPLAIVYLVLVSIAGIKAARAEGSNGMLIAAVLSFIPLGLLGYEAFTNPYFGVIESLSPFQLYYPGLAYVLGLIGLGAVIYAVAKYINLKSGIDIAMIYREIPPERVVLIKIKINYRIKKSYYLPLV